jgi:hypothetical protein
MFISHYTGSIAQAGRPVKRKRRHQIPAESCDGRNSQHGLEAANDVIERAPEALRSNRLLGTTATFL